MKALVEQGIPKIAEIRNSYLVFGRNNMFFYYHQTSCSHITQGLLPPSLANINAVLTNTAYKVGKAWQVTGDRGQVTDDM